MASNSPESIEPEEVELSLRGPLLFGLGDVVETALFRCSVKRPVLCGLPEWCLPGVIATGVGRTDSLTLGHPFAPPDRSV